MARQCTLSEKCLCGNVIHIHKVVVLKSRNLLTEKPGLSVHNKPDSFQIVKIHLTEDFNFNKKSHKTDLVNIYMYHCYGQICYISQDRSKYGTYSCLSFVYS